MLIFSCFYQAPAAAFARLLPISTLSGHGDRVWHASFSPNGHLLGTCGGDRVIRIYALDDTGNWSLRFSLDGTHSRTVRSLAWSADGLYIASASFDATVAIWSFHDGGMVFVYLFIYLSGLPVVACVDVVSRLSLF